MIAGALPPFDLLAALAVPAAAAPAEQPFAALLAGVAVAPLAVVEVWAPHTTSAAAVPADPAAADAIEPALLELMTAMSEPVAVRAPARATSDARPKEPVAGRTSTPTASGSLLVPDAAVEDDARQPEPADVASAVNGRLVSVSAKDVAPQQPPRPTAPASAREAAQLREARMSAPDLGEPSEAPDRTLESALIAAAVATPTIPAAPDIAPTEPARAPDTPPVREDRTATVSHAQSTRPMRMEAAPARQTAKRATVAAEAVPAAARKIVPALGPSSRRPADVKVETVRQALPAGTPALADPLLHDMVRVAPSRPVPVANRPTVSPRTPMAAEAVAAPEGLADRAQLEPAVAPNIGAAAVSSEATRSARALGRAGATPTTMSRPLGPVTPAIKHRDAHAAPIVEADPSVPITAGVHVLETAPAAQPPVAIRRSLPNALPSLTAPVQAGPVVEMARFASTPTSSDVVGIARATTPPTGARQSLPDVAPVLTARVQVASPDVENARSAPASITSDGPRAALAGVERVSARAEHPPLPAQVARSAMAATAVLHVSRTAEVVAPVPAALAPPANTPAPFVAVPIATAPTTAAVSAAPALPPAQAPAPSLYADVLATPHVEAVRAEQVTARDFRRVEVAPASPAPLPAASPAAPRVEARRAPAAVATSNAPAVVVPTAKPIQRAIRSGLGEAVALTPPVPETRLAEAASSAEPAPTPLPGAHQFEAAKAATWLDGLARDIADTGAPDATLRFAVAPEALGEVKVALQPTDAGLDVRLTAADEAARAVLAEAAPQLASEARAAGVRIADTAVDLAGGRQGQNHSQSGEPQRRDPAPDHRAPRAASATTIAPARANPQERYA